MLAVAVARRRASPGRGGLTRKTGVYDVNGERRTYPYWQASREVPPEALPDDSPRRRVTGSGRTPAEAWRRCNANYDAFVRGEPRRGKPAPSPRVTVRQLFDEWQAANEAGAVSAVMARKYRGYFEHHVLPHVGDRRLGALTETELTALFHRTLAEKIHPKTGKPLLSEASRRNIYMALSGCLQFAIRSGYLPHSPLRHVPAPRKAAPADDVDAALDSLDRLLAAIQAPDNPDEARHLLAFLGLRRSERLGLRWSDITGLDTEAPVLHVRGQLARDPATGRLVTKPRTKSGRGRSIALVEPFTGALRRLRRRQQGMVDDGTWIEPDPDHVDMVFLQPNGYPVDQNDDNDDWRQLLGTLGIAHFRAHLTRHLTAVMLARQPNVPIASVMSILGHSTRAMSVYYAHVDRAADAALMRAYGQSLMREPDSRSA